MTISSALYRGRVTHRRVRPSVHSLRYNVFWLLLDLDDIDWADRKLRLFSRNRFNLLSFYDRDYADRSGAPIRPQIDAYLSAADIDLDGGVVRLLTMPRVFGYVFNPISVYYCHHNDGRLMAMVYEVTSTFGVRHSYVIPVPPEDQAEGIIRQGAAKALYVSPFMGMEMDYQFRGHAPSAHLDLLIQGFDAEGILISASVQAKRSPLADAALFSAAMALPLLTLKVMAGIHWEALKLWIKGVPLTQQPAPSDKPVTLQRTSQESRIGR